MRRGRDVNNWIRYLLQKRYIEQNRMNDRLELRLTWKAILVCAVGIAIGWMLVKW